ncbi:Sulfite oxidase [Ananas comosus]|uniref:Sulfite oxidase n=1 Tax=Ananas comosus TaxID=4615 RepID=A0A199UPI7_ANACO|nr:Sulfite oxidase [Ananas comosus]
MQKDYKMFLPSVDWDNIDWSTRKPQMDFPVQSAICSLEGVDVVRQGRLRLLVMHCLVVAVGLREWIFLWMGVKLVEAQRYQKTNVLYASDDMNSDKWAWVLFEAVADIPEDAEIIAKRLTQLQMSNLKMSTKIWN